MSGLDIVPAERRDAAADALRGAFGPRALTALEPVSGGVSGALIYRAEVAGRPYLLRMEVLPGAGLRDPQRAYVCMRAAAEAGVAPRLHHADAQAGVAVMDFISGMPLSTFPGGQEGLVEALGELIARVHAIEPAFPAPRADYAAIVDFMLSGLRRSSLFAPGLLDPHAEGLALIRPALRNQDPGVSSHNDPNPRNLLFDGERLWLVDWELAFRNDPMVDLAVLANDFAPTPALVDTLLRSATKRTPDALLRARLILNRQLVRAFYACVLLGAFAARQRETPDDLSAPEPDAFRAAVAQGKLKPASPDTTYLYGKMQLAGFLAGLASPEFREALSVALGGA